MNEGASSGELTIDEVAETLNVSAAFVSRLIARGALPQTGSGAGTRFKAIVVAYRDRADAEHLALVQADEGGAIAGCAPSR